MDLDQDQAQQKKTDLAANGKMSHREAGGSTSSPDDGDGGLDLESALQMDMTQLRRLELGEAEKG